MDSKQQLKEVVKSLSENSKQQRIDINSVVAKVHTLETTVADIREKKDNTETLKRSHKSFTEAYNTTNENFKSSLDSKQSQLDELKDLMKAQEKRHFEELQKAKAENIELVKELDKRCEEKFAEINKNLLF